MSAIRYKDENGKWVDIAIGGAQDITVDSTTSTTSTNPVQNKVITTALDKSKIYISDTAPTDANANFWLDTASSPSGGMKLYRHDIHIEGLSSSGAPAVYDGVIMKGRFYSTSNTPKTIADFWLGGASEKLGIYRILKYNQDASPYVGYDYSILSKENSKIGIFYAIVGSNNVIYETSPTAVSGYTYTLTDTVTEV